MRFLGYNFYARKHEGGLVPSILDNFVTHLLSAPWPIVKSTLFTIWTILEHAVVFLIVALIAVFGFTAAMFMVLIATPVAGLFGISVGIEKIATDEKEQPTTK